jgi:hypothetical protein
MGPNITRIELEERIRRRGQTEKLVEFLGESGIMLFIVSAAVMLLGNAVYWMGWVADGVWGETMARFNTGWVIPVVCAVWVGTTAALSAYLEHLQKSDRVLYNALSGTLAGDK